MLLIVERDPRFVAKLEAHLTISGLNAFFVPTTADAIQQIKSMRANFILVDISAVTAMEELETLKSYADTRKIPLLIIEGHQKSKELASRLRQKGYRDFMALPFKVSQLKARIESMRTQTDPFLGATLGPPGHEVEITRKLGSGGMGSVYEARQAALDRRVAVKFLAENLKDGQFGEAQRFQKEARAMAKLRSPYIAQVFFAGKHRERDYMVMEYIDGPNLDKYLRAKGRLKPVEALSICRDVLFGLSQAHKHGQTHRDIKPANIILNPDHQAVLLDFGLVRGEGEEKMTQAGTVLGTPLYMAPEQVRGEGVNPRGDLYALGIILFELLVGRPPFHGKDFYAILMQHLNEPLPKPEKFGVTIHPAIWAIIERLAQKEEARRYQTADEACEEVKRVLAVYSAVELEDAGGTVALEAPKFEGNLAGLAIDSSGSAVARFGRIPDGSDTALGVFNGLIQAFGQMEVLGELKRGNCEFKDGRMVVFPFHEGLAFIHSPDAKTSQQFDRFSAADLAQYFNLGRRP